MKLRLTEVQTGFEPLFLYKENHALDAWFRRAYGDEQKILLR